jgi:hypothetical protein
LRVSSRSLHNRSLDQQRDERIGLVPREAQGRIRNTTYSHVWAEKGYKKWSILPCVRQKAQGCTLWDFVRLYDVRSWVERWCWSAESPHSASRFTLMHILRYGAIRGIPSMIPRQITNPRPIIILIVCVLRP